MTRVPALALLTATVVACSTAAAVRPPAGTADADARPRLTVTVQDLIDRDHQLSVTAGTEVIWGDAHFERVWFPPGTDAPRVERIDRGFRAVFDKPGTFRGRFTIVGGHRSNDVYPLIVTVSDR